MLGKLVRGAFEKVGMSVIRYHQTYEADRLALLNRSGIELVVDVGANSGQYAKRLRRSGYKGDLISVEPLPDAFARLQQAMVSDVNWRGVNVAVGPLRGTASLNVSADSVCSSFLPPSATLLNAIPTAKVVQMITVDVIPLDDLVGFEQRKVWLKLDVQGFERQALEGASELLKRVKVLELELGLKPSYEKSYTLEDAIPDLQKMGFSLVSIGRGVSDPKTGQLIDADVLLERL